VNLAAVSVGVLIVIMAVRPNLNRARTTIYQARQSVQEILRRKHSLSQQIRVLARESLHQRLTSVSDKDTSAALEETIGSLTGHLQQLEKVDRRVLVFDERRGIQETGWILRVQRTERGPPLEPSRIAEAWADGRYMFFWAADEQKARRKAQIRFPAEQGYRVVEVLRHDADLSEPPALSTAMGAGRRIAEAADAGPAG
jgi:hypothetical protein